MEKTVGDDLIESLIQAVVQPKGDQRRSATRVQV